MSFELRALHWVQSPAGSLPHAPRPFSFSDSSDRVLHFCIGCPQTIIILPVAFHIAGIIEIKQHAKLICCDGVLLTFILGWPGTAILQISTSQVVWMAGVSHCSQKKFQGFFFGSTGFELRALCLLVRYSVPESHLSPLKVLKTFFLTDFIVCLSTYLSICKSPIYLSSIYLSTKCIIISLVYLQST
jgi:hypothetical protein